MHITCEASRAYRHTCAGTREQRSISTKFLTLEDMCQIKEMHARASVHAHACTNIHTHSHMHTHNTSTHALSYSTSCKHGRPRAPWSARQVWCRLRSAWLLSPCDRSSSRSSAPCTHPAEAAGSKTSIRRYTTSDRSTCVSGPRCRALRLQGTHIHAYTQTNASLPK